MREDRDEQFEQRGIQVVSGVLRDEALTVDQAYGERENAVVHNARGHRWLGRSIRGAGHQRLKAVPYATCRSADDTASTAAAPDPRH